MVAGLAAAKTSAGAPSLIWVASAELPAKLNVTLTPGLAASKSLPIWVNDSVSDAAANTVIWPVTALAGAPAGAAGGDEAGASVEPQPTRDTAAMAARAAARRP